MTHLSTQQLRCDPSFERVYRSCFPRLVQLLTPILDDTTAAEDVAQEVMARLLTRFDRLDHSTPLWPWLRTVGVRLAIDALRKRSVEGTLGEVPDDIRPTLAYDDRYWCEDGPQLLDALRKLSTRQRTALCLRYLEDRDPHDAAGHLGLKRGAFDQLVFRARRNLMLAYR
jgi:RNA polymerase sigma factor (sigma-70 family)